MRRFLSVVAILTMLLALAVPAFAAEEGASVSTSVLPEIKEATGVKEGQQLVIEKTSVSAEQVEAAIAASDKAGEGVVASDVFEIHLEDIVNGGEVQPDGIITVVLSGYDGVVDVLALRDGAWVSVLKSVNADGTVTLAFDHFCPVIVLTKAAVQPEAPSKPEDSGKPDGKPSKPTSPQTGFDATGWIVATAGLLLCAGVCFVCARKKVSE